MRRTLIVGATVAAVGLVTVPAQASGGGITCTNGTTTVTYLPTGGYLHMAFHDSFDATGGEHVTGTANPVGLTLTDGTTSTVYKASGALWFGGYLRPDGTFVGTDTGFINIIAGGVVVDRVASVDHVNFNGSGFTFNFGSCAPPGGG
jgi:hypothetical protein